MAVFDLVANAFSPLGGLEIGYLAERLTVSYAIGINAALCLLITAAIFLWSQNGPHPPPRDRVNETG